MRPRYPLEWLKLVMHKFITKVLSKKAPDEKRSNIIMIKKETIQLLAVLQTI